MTADRWALGRRNSAVLAKNLRAWLGGDVASDDDAVNSDAGALAVAHAINSVVNVCEALARRKG